ncbi:MAG: tyrosine-type recombinase/integrase [Oscillospiraceae bacterium]|jgi:site-specific recombinase XerD|nr:tyrosine-type recombinase/integrase [Oscillospiraceae bacterium]
MDYRLESFPLLREFLTYHETIRGHARKTSDEYFLDLRAFFRFLKRQRGLVPTDAKLEEIPIGDVALPLVASVTLTDVYEYMAYLARERANQPNSPNTGYGLGTAARARKVAAIRSLYRYLTAKAHLLSENPVQELDSPKIKKTLPRYLSLEESLRLLSTVEGPQRDRDYCILTLFLNCGLRISELAGLNLADVRDDTLRVVGKGNKERLLYLNDACREALRRWLTIRATLPSLDKQALFLSHLHRRISVKGIHFTVKKRLQAAGLDTDLYSSHKLRHTAATLMLQNGVDVRTLQELLGHEHLNTTQIYTHVEDGELRAAARANPLSKVKPAR